MNSQSKIDQILQKKALEICEIEAKYHEMLKHEFLVRSIEIKKIPGFWCRCIRNHHTLPSLISTKDWELLQHIDDISLDEFTSRNKVKTYKLTLELKPNPFVNNNLIWVAVNNDQLQSYSASGIDFKASYEISYFDEGSHIQSFFRLFLGENKGEITHSAFVFDIVYGIKIDLWEDPVKYHNME